MVKVLSMYSTSLCNLSCRYCYISKNPTLIELDKEFEKAAIGDYYPKLLDKFVEDPTHIQRLEIWGGEPTLFIERSFGLIEHLYNISKDFNEVFVSSNYCADVFFDKIQILMNYLGKFDRDFTFTSQVSIDGPEAITDKARGSGVTAKVVNNIDRLLNELKVPDNVTIEFNLKPTLDIESLKLLTNKEFAIDYFKFFEDEIISKIRDKKDRHFVCEYYPIPNLAVPAPYTKEDGKLLANVEKVLFEIEQENKERGIYRYYKTLRLFYRKNPRVKENGRCVMRGGYCGTGRGMIGLLPLGKACGCHRDFTDVLESYRKASKYDLQDRVIDTSINSEESLNGKVLVWDNKKDELIHERRMGVYYDNPSTTIITSAMSLIKMLSLAGQIEPKYVNDDSARIAAYKMMAINSNCADDCINATGTVSCWDSALLKLFLNGAIDYMFDEGVFPE